MGYVLLYLPHIPLIVHIVYVVTCLFLRLRTGFRVAPELWVVMRPVLRLGTPLWQSGYFLCASHH